MTEINQIKKIIIKPETYILKLKSANYPDRYLLIMDGKEIYEIAKYKKVSSKHPHGSISIEPESTTIGNNLIFVPVDVEFSEMTVEELVGQFLD